MHEQPNDYGLIIGLNDYPEYGGGGRSLTGAVPDAEAVDRWLRDRNAGGGLPDANVELVRSSPDPLFPKRGDIDQALRALVSKARENGARRFYFYFSGHGHVTGESRNDVALCLPHWSRDYRNAALSSTRYLDYLVKCTPFTELVMLLDCCRIRQVAAIGLPSELDCATPQGLDRRIMVGYASEYLKAAFEGSTARGTGSESADDEGGEPEGNEVRGFFTETLLAGLRAGAARSEGGVTARALKRYLEVHVERISGRRQRPQVPLDMTEEEADTMLFGAALPEANVEISFSEGRRGEIQLIAPNAEVVRAGDAADEPWRLRLERALYVLLEVETDESQPLRFFPAAEVKHVRF